MGKNETRENYEINLLYYYYFELKNCRNASHNMN
jgi:hypothetical protein